MSPLLFWVLCVVFVVFYVCSEVEFGDEDDEVL